MNGSRAAHHNNSSPAMACAVLPEDVEEILGSPVVAIKGDRRSPAIDWLPLRWTSVRFRVRSGLCLLVLAATDSGVAALPERVQGLEHRRIESLGADVFFDKSRRPGLSEAEIQELVVVRGRDVVRMYQNVGVTGIAKDYSAVEAFVAAVAGRLPNPVRLPAGTPDRPVWVIH